MDIPNYKRTKKLAQTGYAYIACWVSWLDDRIYASLPFEAKGLYLDLYLLAGRYNKAGALVDDHGALEVNDIAYLLRCDQTQLSEILDLLKLRGLVELCNGVWTVTAFTNEQVDLNERREQARSRMAKHRGKQEVTPEAEPKKELEVEEELDVRSSYALQTRNISEIQREKELLTHNAPSFAERSLGGANIPPVVDDNALELLSAASAAIHKHTGKPVRGKEAMEACQALVDASKNTGITIDDGARMWADWWKNRDWRVDESLSQFQWSVFLDNVEPVMMQHTCSYSNHRTTISGE